MSLFSDETPYMMQKIARMALDPDAALAASAPQKDQSMIHVSQIPPCRYCAAGDTTVTWVPGYPVLHTVQYETYQKQEPCTNLELIREITRPQSETE